MEKNKNDIERKTILLLCPPALTPAKARVRPD